MKKVKPKEMRWREFLRSCLSFALVLVLALGCVTPVRAVEGEEGGAGAQNTVTEDILNMDFNGDPDITGQKMVDAWGFSPKPGTGTENAAVGLVKSPTASEGSNDYCMEVRSYRGQLPIFRKPDMVVEDKVIVYEYMVAKSSDPNKELQSEIRLFAKADNSSYLKITNGVIENTQIALTSESWVKVAMKVNFKTGVGELFVQDELVKTVEEISSGPVFCSRDASEKYILIDNLRIYEVIESSEESTTESTESTVSTDNFTESVQDIVNLDFNESATEIQNACGLDKLPTNTNVQWVANPKNGDDKCLLINYTGLLRPFYKDVDGNTIVRASKKLVYEYDVMVSPTADPSQQNGKLFADWYGSVSYLSVVNGVIEGTSISVTTDRWIKVSLAVDFTKSTDNGILYVEGTQVKTVSDVDKLGFKVDSTGLMVDNLRIYEVLELGTESTETTESAENTESTENTETPETPDPPEEPEVVEDIRNLDFNEVAAQIENALQLEPLATNENVQLVSNPDRNGDKCLQIQTQLALYFFKCDITGSSLDSGLGGKTVVIEYELSGVKGDNVPDTKLFAYKTSGETYLSIAGGKIDLGNGESVEVEAGKWTKVSLVIDYTNGFYSATPAKVYVDGKPVKDVTIPADDARLRRISFQCTGEGKLLIDNMRIYEATKPNENPEIQDTPVTPPPVGNEESDKYSPDFLNVNFMETNKKIEEYFYFTDLSTNQFVGVVANPADNTDKCLEIRNYGGVLYLFTHYINSMKVNVLSRQMVYEFMVSASADAGKNLQSNVRLFATQSGNRPILELNDGKIEGVDVTAENWVKVALVANHATQTGKIYINDEYVKDVENVDGPVFYVHENSKSGYVLVDNIRVYEGSEPHIPGTGDVIGTDVYVNRTFDEIYKYDYEELEITDNRDKVTVVSGTDGKRLQVVAGGKVTYITSASSNFIVAQAKVSVESVTGNTGSVFTVVDSEKNSLSLLDIQDDALTTNGTLVATLSAGTWADVAVSVDVLRDTYTVYVNGEAVEVATGLAITGISNASSFETVISAGSLLIDAVRVYDGKTPWTGWMSNDNPSPIYLSDELIKDIMGSKVAVQLVANVLYNGGRREKSQATGEIICENGKAYMTLADLKILFGDAITLGDASEKNGSYDVYAVAAANGYTFVHELEDRLIIFSQEEITLGDARYFEDNVKEVNKLLQFERPSADKIKELFAEKSTGHPRLLITEDDVTRIQGLYNGGNEYIVRWAQNAIAAADIAVRTPEFDYYHAPLDSMDNVDEALPMIINLGIAYFLTDDEAAKAEYVAKAKRMAETICNLPDWNPLSYLDVGELSFILGIAYDWFYDEYTETEKALIEKNLMEKGVGIQNKIYYGQVSSSEVYWTWWDNDNNWNFICNGGTLLAAIALYDVYPDICAQVISNNLRGMEFMMESYFPEGVWHEGCGYWAYSLSYVAYTMKTLNNTFGDDFNFLCSPGLDKTGWFGLGVTGSTGVINSGDSVPTFVDCKSVLWCASTFKDKNLMAARLQEMELNGYIGDGRDIVFFDESVVGDQEVEVALDTVFDSMGTLRQKWYDHAATSIVFVGSKPHSGHAHMDFGSFVVDMLGQRVVSDPGADNYNAPGYFAAERFYYYRTRPEGHNIYIINPTDTRDDYGGFDYYGGVTTNTPVVSKDKGAYTIMDLSDVYNEDTSSALRGYMLTDDRRNVLIRDEINLKYASELYSYLHTHADVTFDPADPDVAILMLNGTKYKVVIDVKGDTVESYTFKVVEAKSRGDYGVSDAVFTNFRKLEIYVKTNGAGPISITTKIMGYDDPAADVALIDTPIEDWSEDMIPDGDAVMMPSVDMIYMDGEPMEKFDPDIVGYTQTLHGSAKLPVLTATSEKYDRIEVTSPDDFTGEYTITVYDNEDENLYRVYCLSFTKRPELKPVDGRERYPVANMTASDSPEAESNGYVPESTVDNDFSDSRWTALCAYEGDSEWLLMELTKVEKVHKIGIAFNRGERRKTKFTLEVSVDGENWREVFDGLSSGLSSGLEYFWESEEGVDAKFVRYTGFGNYANGDNTYNGYSNIFEFVVLGAKNSAQEIYELGSESSVNVLINNTAASELTGVAVNGEPLDSEDYVVTNASSNKVGTSGTVSLNANYMENLAAGEYTLTLSYQDGSSAEIKLIVVEAGEVDIITSGTTDEYEIGSDKKVTIHATGLLDKFIGVKVNGVLIDRGNYDLTEGSTIVTFKDAYIRSLAAGEYKVSLLYSGSASAETTLTVTAATGADESTEGETPTTGADESTEGETPTTGTDESTEGETPTTGADESTEGETPTTGADESTEGETPTIGADESTEGEIPTTGADDSTEVDTDDPVGGDPDTGDMNRTGAWLWLIMVAMVMMTGYVIFFELDRKKQR